MRFIKGASEVSVLSTKTRSAVSDNEEKKRESWKITWKVSTPWNNAYRILSTNTQFIRIIQHSLLQSNILTFSRMHYLFKYYILSSEVGRSILINLFGYYIYFICLNLVVHEGGIVIFSALHCAVYGYCFFFLSSFICKCDMIWQLVFGFHFHCFLDS